MGAVKLKNLNNRLEYHTVIMNIVIVKLRQGSGKERQGMAKGERP